MKSPVIIRNALPTDLAVVIGLDSLGLTGDKAAYWREIFDRYVNPGGKSGPFLVAEIEGQVIGFIIGEVRAWEFGSPPCGWVFALGVTPNRRELGVGQLLLQELCQRLQQAGVTTLRTMVDRENKLTLSFFRSQGLRTGRYIELEKEIDD